MALNRIMDKLYVIDSQDYEWSGDLGMGIVITIENNCNLPGSSQSLSHLCKWNVVQPHTSSLALHAE